MDAIKTEYKEIIFDSKSEAVFGEEENAMRKTIHLMGVFVLIFLLFISLFPAVSFGEIITIKHTVKQTFGGGQSPDDARISAMAKAKREALEKAGTYIESLTVVKNSQVEKDEILALTAGVLKAEVISQDNFATKDAFGIEIIVNVVVDTSVLEERVKKQLQDRTHLSQLKDTQKREKDLLQKVAQLEEENRKLTANKQSTTQLKKEFHKASQGLTAVDWCKKVLALWDGGKVVESKKAIEYLNNAIKLQPDYANAYNLRGSAYIGLGQYQLALADINQAIQLNPDDAGYLYNRAAVYSILGLYKRAIEDYNEALRLKPHNIISGIAYFGRGNAYQSLDQYQLAIENYNKAIRLRPDYASAYYNRGVAYRSLDQYQLAIEDYNEAIRLQPDYVDAYYNRGIAYLIQGNDKLGCRDAQKACDLGKCELLKNPKIQGLCR